MWANAMFLSKGPQLQASHPHERAPGHKALPWPLQAVLDGLSGSYQGVWLTATHHLFTLLLPLHSIRGETQSPSWFIFTAGTLPTPQHALLALSHTRCLCHPLVTREPALPNKERHFQRLPLRLAQP